MVKAPKAPARGDVVWLDMNPQAGHEEAGRRPALAVSPKSYNAKVGLALFCPITSHEKGYPFEVRLPSQFRIRGVILADQVKSLDWQARKAAHVERLPADLLDDVIAKLMALFSETS